MGNRSLEKAVRVIEFLATSNKGVRHKDITKALALNKTTTSRILYELESHQLAARLTDNTFTLGNRILWWETCYRRNFELLGVVHSHLEKVRDLTSETCTFSIVVGYRSVILDQAISRHVTSSRYDLGSDVPLHAGASGKVMLAHLDSDKRREFLSQDHLDSLTQQTIIDRKRLERQLKEIRTRGFAISRGERFLNTASIAFPVFTSPLEVAGAIAVVGPSDRLSNSRLKDIVPLVLEEARLLTARLSKGGMGRE